MTLPVWIDPPALLLVVGGALLLGAMTCGGSAARAGLRPVWRGEVAGEAAAVTRLIHAADKAVSHRGLFAAETLAPPQLYLRAVLSELADARDAESFAVTMAELREVASVSDRHRHAYWIAVADAAPALGMAGTVAGMIGMASGSGGGTTASGAMLALALSSTLYGLLLSAVIAMPLAAHAGRIAEERAHWRQRLSDALVALVARETAGRP